MLSCVYESLIIRRINSKKQPHNDYVLPHNDCSSAAGQQLSNTLYTDHNKSPAAASQASCNGSSNGLVILQGNVQVVSYDIVEYSSQFIDS